MTDAKRSEQVTLDAILNLLTDEESARVSTAEVAIGLTEGAEYLGPGAGRPARQGRDCAEGISFHVVQSPSKHGARFLHDLLAERVFGLSCCRARPDERDAG
jgi:hypothetical protein